MKETGMIMSGNHPKLILDGIKTQTRRTYELNEINKEPDKWQATPTLNPLVTGFYTLGHPQEIIRVKCPYGQVGDRLWVRETWGLHFAWDGTKPREIPPSKLKLAEYKTDLPTGDVHKWRSSRFMPKGASRIWLEITEVRVERVQEITDIDARCEGIPNSAYAINGVTSFKKLWDSLNAKRGYGWEVNPWVWTINFRRLE